MTTAQVVWNPKQSEALECAAPFVDIEGGVGGAKTTTLLGKVVILCLRHPGIHCFLGRWTEDALNSQLKPAWRDFAHKCGLSLQWHPDEEYDEVIGTGARVYLRGLRTSESVARYQKLRGLNLTFIGIDQAEELPADFANELVGRLRQVGYDGLKQIWYVCQPVNQDHWIATEFPEDNSREGYHYLHMNVYDNRHIVGEEFIAMMEAKYPEGSSQRRTLLEGKRGLATVGQAVYAGMFRQAVHENNALRMNPHSPLLEAWDYGHSHPCVVWAQLLHGRCSILGGVLGEDMGVDTFVPMALEARNQWFQQPMEILTTGDPAGLAESSQGLPVKLKDVMAELGVYITAVDGANRVEIRDQAIQVLMRYMTKTATDGGPAFQINSQRQCVVRNSGTLWTPFLTDAFSAGYIWDEKARQGLAANIRRPKKDGYYDHGMNCVEYVALAYGPVSVTQKDEERLERKFLRSQQRDDDPADRLIRQARQGVRRGGY